MSNQHPNNWQVNPYQQSTGGGQPAGQGYGAGQPAGQPYGGQSNGYGEPIAPRYDGQYSAYVGNPGQYVPIGYAQKSILVAGVLGIFLGTFGIHNFYLGRHSLGIIQLLITLLSFGLLAWISTLWGLVEGILYLVNNSPRWSYDGYGYPLRY